MTAAEMLAALREADAKVTLWGGRVLLAGSLEAVSPDVLRQAGAHQDELADLLRCEDPRPGLAEDTGLWALLLAFAFQQDGTAPNGLYGSLHAFRCVGTRLAITEGKARLVRPSGEDEDPGYDDYAQRYLTPHLADLRALLARLVEAAAAVTA